MPSTNTTASLNATTLKLGGVKKITFTPWVSESQIGTEDYVLDNIIADTLSISQDDPTTNTIECETSDSPIFENITQGKYQVAMESGDIQPKLLNKLFGFSLGTAGSGGKQVAFAPAKASSVWAKLSVEFVDGDQLIAPKVKLGSKIDASSLKTGMVRGAISGSCYDTEIKESDAGTPFLCPFYVVPNGCTEPKIVATT